jgi:hypothetical protein
LLSPSGQQAVNQPTGTNLTTNTLNAADLNNAFYVDGFTTTLYGGIGVLPTAWVAATTYPGCQEVSYLGGNYLYTGFLSGTPSTTTPGTSSAVWYPITNGSRPTQLDCAFYTAAASIITGTGTQTTGGAGSAIILGSGIYGTAIGLTEPTVPAAGNGVISIYGKGQTASTIQQVVEKGDGFPTFYQPDTLVGYAFASFTVQGLTIDSNWLANANAGIYGASSIVIRDVTFLNPTDFNDHSVEIGNSADTPHGWVFQPQIDNITIGNNRGSAKNASITATVSGGVPSFTIVNGGTGYNFWGSDTTVQLTGFAQFGNPCSSMGTTSLTIVSGVITGITSSATGCVAPLYVLITDLQNIAYGLKLSNVSDSQFINSVNIGNVGTTAGLWINGISSQLVIAKYHPDGMPTGLLTLGSGVTFDHLQCDTITYNCANVQGGGVVTFNNPIFEWSSTAGIGAYADYLFPLYSGVPGYSEPQAVNIYAEGCGNQATFGGYAHFVTAAGVVDTAVGSDSANLPSYVHDINPIYCNLYSDGATPPPLGQITPTMIGQQIQMANGSVGNQWNFNLGTSRLGGGGVGAQTMAVTQTNSTTTADIGEYAWDWSNVTPATSGNNYGSPQVGHFGTYWNGSASVAFGVNQQLLFGSGSTPTATYAFTHSGTIPASLTYTFDEPVTLPTGSTAVTQSCASNTDVATDAYVATCAAQVYPGAGVANSTGSAWGTSYTVGTAANDLVQLNGSALVPTTNLPTAATSTLGVMAPDGSTITCSAGTCSAASGTAPSASASCQGTASSSATISFFGMGNFTANCTASSSTQVGWIMTRSGTLSHLTFRCSTTGVNTSSGVVTLYDVASGSTTETSTGLTVTYGTTTANTAVNDNTHTFAYSQGDSIVAKFTTQATETLAGCSVAFQY